MSCDTIVGSEKITKYWLSEPEDDEEPFLPWNIPEVCRGINLTNVIEEALPRAEYLTYCQGENEDYTGMAMVARESTGISNTHEIVALCTSAKGLGHKLLSSVLRMVPEEDTVILKSVRSAIGFYLKQGFTFADRMYSPLREVEMEYESTADKPRLLQKWLDRGSEWATPDGFLMVHSRPSEFRQSLTPPSPTSDSTESIGSVDGHTDTKRRRLRSASYHTSPICGAPTSKGGKCTRRGRCHYHLGNVR